eukprot:m.233286 g.233286  ORF g.233286 m.233286 type:complete len:895 (+) comp33639_c0_seq1:188-2872(+)
MISPLVLVWGLTLVGIRISTAHPTYLTPLYYDHRLVEGGNVHQPQRSAGSLAEAGFEYLHKLSVPSSNSSCGGLGDVNDWLVTGCATRSTFTTTDVNGSANFILTNGIVSRTLVVDKVTNLLSTTSVRILGGAGAGEVLRAPAPEVLLVINDVEVIVGGPTPSSSDTRLRATFAGVRNQTVPPRAGGFHWIPGARGSNPNTAWPPLGTATEFDHAVDCSRVGAGVGSVVITVVLELYDETSAFGKRVRMKHTCSNPLYVYNMSIAVYLENYDRSISVHTDASVSKGRLVKDTAGGEHYGTNGFISTDGIDFFGPGLSDWKASDDTFESYFLVEVFHDVLFSTTPPYRGMSRYGLLDARMSRVLSPQMEQNPIKVNGFCKGGVKVPPPDGQPGSVGYWCYDDEGTESIKALISQCIDAGADILVLADNMNNTWRSTVGNEFVSEVNTSWFKSIVDVAHAGGVEVGAYQLLLDARSATALNQAAPPDAATLPNAGYDTMDPHTLKTCHNHGKTSCTGGSGCCAMCGATTFYDAMEASMHAWWRATGVSVVAQDGAESATPCANESHVHHHGLNDSLWQQYKAVRRTFNTYLTTPMQDRLPLRRYAAPLSSSPSLSPPPPTSWSVPRVGFIAGMPGSVIEAGEAKVPGGYSETTYSLPRWTWIDRTRQQVIADAFSRDYDTSIGQRMFPIPFTAPYHPSQPDPTDPSKFVSVVGYQSAATLSPLEDHLVETEWALSTYFGTGVLTNIRAPVLYEGPQSQALVKKWFDWQKKYRRVLTAESMTLTHGTVCWGRDEPMANSSCTSTDVDAILHRAPKHYYPDIDERALAMVWNPTNATIVKTLAAPLYYAGLTVSGGTTSVKVSQEGAAPTTVNMGANNTVALSINLKPRELTWFVITE